MSSASSARPWTSCASTSRSLRTTMPRGRPLFDAPGTRQYDPSNRFPSSAPSAARPRSEAVTDASGDVRERVEVTIDLHRSADTGAPTIAGALSGHLRRPSEPDLEVRVPCGAAVSLPPAIGRVQAELL